MLGDERRCASFPNHCIHTAGYVEPLTAKVAPVAPLAPVLGRNQLSAPQASCPNKARLFAVLPARYVGERVTVQADHQHALTAPVEAIAGKMGTVVLSWVEIQNEPTGLLPRS